MKSYILPLVLSYLTPTPVAIIGVGAISAAVMSSADSCILASSSVITKNFYHEIIRPRASTRELRWVMRLCIIVVAFVATVIAIFSSSVYGLFVLCADLIYVILFPQLVCVLWLPGSNAYGCIAGYLVSLILRMISGESLLGIPALVQFPLYDPETERQLFPYRTFSMIVGGLFIIIVSVTTNILFQRGIIPVRYDIFNSTAQKTAEMRAKKLDIKCPEEEEQMVELKAHEKN